MNLSSAPEEIIISSKHILSELLSALAVQLKELIFLQFSSVDGSVTGNESGRRGY